MTDCLHGPRCAECQRERDLAGERERRADAAQLAARRPPTPAESAALSPGESLARFGVEGGTRLLEAAWLGRAGLTTPEQLQARERAARSRRPGIAYREEPDRLPPPAPRFQPATWACPRCHKRTAGPFCDACEADDPEIARPPP